MKIMNEKEMKKNNGDKLSIKMPTTSSVSSIRIKFVIEICIFKQITRK